ncbi:MAG TPA: AAA family ATPase [Candidatus Micrarchaeaceae archaeon]|nr:AAA family ATPase [Candidatus Micrarchaeaceae archaeon]
MTGIIGMMEEARNPIVGRDAELEAVDALLTRVESGFAVLTLEGEAGIGKTTVWLEALRRARERRAQVLVTRPTEAEVSLSYAGLTDLFDAVADGVIAGLPVPQREAISAALLRSPAPRRGIDERALCAAVLSMLRLISADRPLVVAVDDAQWLDSPSARVLSFAVRRLDAETIGFVAAARVGSTPVPPRFDLSADPGRHQTIVVGALSVGALHELLKQRTGRSLSRPIMVKIAGVCGGNPFYALEIATALPDRPLQAGHLPVPDSLTELLVARVGQLPAATRRALLAAAALSQPRTDLVNPKALSAAQRTGIVSIERDRIQFAHPLLASVVYSQANDLERRSLHRRLAQVVVEPEERARHAALGAEEPDAAIAHDLEDAAVLARSRGAPGAAAVLLDLAVGLSPPNDSDRAVRMVAAASAWFDTGDLARAQITLGEALASTLDARLRARALHLLGQIHARRSSFTEATALAFQALEAADDDDALRTELQLDLCYYTVNLGDLPGAVRHARGAMTAAEQAGDAGALADALAAVTMTEFAAGSGYDEVRMRRARDLEDPNRIRAWQNTPAFLHGSILLYTGNLEPALSILSKLHTETLERGEESQIPFSCFYQAWACVWRGDLLVAHRLADEAMQTAALLDDPAAHAIALAASALVHAHDGSTDLAREEAHESIRLFQDLGWAMGTSWPLWALGLAELSSGNPMAVDAALGPLATMLSAMGGGDPFLGVFLPEEIEALVELGLHDRAENLISWLERRGRDLDRAWTLAAAGRCRGLLDAARGDTTGALAVLDRALAEHDRCAMPFERARTLLVLGRVQRRNGMRGEARSTLVEALAGFERYGARLWAERTRGELARLGGRGASPEKLTATEMRVAEMAASGMANREIAERVFLTTKAVESNLTHVYRKLDIRSRGGLARALDAKRATPTTRG